MITAKTRPLPSGNTRHSTAFEQAVNFLPMFRDELMRHAARTPAFAEKTREIRLRAGQCIVLETGEGGGIARVGNAQSGSREVANYSGIARFGNAQNGSREIANYSGIARFGNAQSGSREVGDYGGIARVENPQNPRHQTTIPVTAEHLRDLIQIFCDYSIHSYARQISEGFITLEGGHRAGFCGTAVMNSSDKNKVETVRDISSINLRIAREFPGCSDRLFELLPLESLKCLLIIGKPLSAKTTVLRDLARNISRTHKVTVIDERGELAAKSRGVITADLGANTDVLDGFPKRGGFMTALRALSPDFIICDEIAGDGESVAECLNSGVSLIMTAHCGSVEEAIRGTALSDIIKHVSHIALLGTGRNIGVLQNLWQRDNGTSKKLVQIGENDTFHFSLVRGGHTEK
ncbi:MAG: hypothetical protein FWH20_03845 [Oscillospiraceae bacterium]|nr:hypothetical protein [Oscillospiraceae bacterium]